MPTYIFTQEMERREKARRTLRENIRADRERFHSDTEHEWYTSRAMRRAWLYACAVTGALFIILYCLRSLP